MHPLFDLTGKQALVTGSSRGIGFAIAEGLAEASASIVLNARTEERLKQAEEHFTAKGFQVTSKLFDVTDVDAIETAIAEIESNAPIDILVNNAGIQIRGQLEDFSTEDWQHITNTNINSVFYMSRAVAKHMLKRGEGKIINIGSVNSQTGRPTIAPYVASKGAVLNLTKGMALDWGPKGLQVNAIGPGYFKTEINQALIENVEFSDWLISRTPHKLLVS